MDLGGQVVDLLGQLGIEVEELLDLSRALELLLRELLTVMRVGFSVDLVPIGLSGLSKQDQRCRVGSLKREREVEQDVGVAVEVNDVEQRSGVAGDPERDEDRLADDVAGRTEEASGFLGDSAETARAERARGFLMLSQLQMAERVDFANAALELRGKPHPSRC